MGCCFLLQGAGVQPRQDPGDTLRINGIGKRERERGKTRETSLDRAKSVRERERERVTRRGVQSLAESGNAFFFFLLYFLP